MANLTTAEIDALRMKVATSCRILGMFGLVRGSTGHVSVRIPGTDEMLIRCRGGNELGLMFTGVHNIRRMDFDGGGDAIGVAHGVPNETAIHGEIYKAKPDVQSVVHAHPYYALMCGITALEYRPLFGAFDLSALGIVIKGIPVFNRSVTVTNQKLGADMLTAIGDRDVLLMRGHGITVTGKSVETATALAVKFDELSKIMWEVATSGREGLDILPEDLEQYSRPPGGEHQQGTGTGWMSLEGVENWPWNQYVKQLEVAGIGLPLDVTAP